jgi:hypothetical protein
MIGFVKKDILNQTFGRLKVIESAPNIMNNANTRSFVAWLCECECGKKLTVKAKYLLAGKTKSCGCLNDKQRILHAKQMAKAKAYDNPNEASAREAFKSTYCEEGDTITFEFFLEQSQKQCSYCGVAPSNCFNKYRGIITCSKEDYKAAKFIYNGLDRVDNKLPHTPENCIPCCAKCNTAKNDRSQKDFLDWAERAYQHFVVKKGGKI